MNEEELATFFFPLYGVRYEGDVLFVGGGAILQFDVFEWRMWEHSEIFHAHLEDDYAVEGLGAQAAKTLNWKNPLPYGVGVVASEDLETLLPKAEAVARDVVLALRLHKEGAFMDPAFFGIYGRTSTGSVWRRPGLYRQKAYDDRGANLDAFFTEEPYVLEAADRDPLDELALALDAYHAPDAIAATDLAFDNFLFSFAPNLDIYTRLALLFTATEAIFGRFNSTVAGVSFVDRTIAAAGAGEVDSECLRAFLADEARQWRNTVAHTGPETLPAGASEAVEHLSRAVRCALRCLVHFLYNVTTGQGRERLIAATGEPTLPPRKLFNTILAAAVAGDEDAHKLLCPRRAPSRDDRHNV